MRLRPAKGPLRSVLATVLAYRRTVRKQFRQRRWGQGPRPLCLPHNIYVKHAALRSKKQVKPPAWASATTYGPLFHRLLQTSRQRVIPRETCVNPSHFQRLGGNPPPMANQAPDSPKSPKDGPPRPAAAHSNPPEKIPRFLQQNFCIAPGPPGSRGPVLHRRALRLCGPQTT